MKIDCISDLHGHYPKLEGGDLLIVAGDLTARDTEPEYFQCFDWIHEQNYKKKILIAGNHDNELQIQKYLGPVGGASKYFIYLCDSGFEYKKLKIWGSPWTKTFKGMNPHCKAFTFDTEEELAEKWALIPNDVDILITHSPPYGIGDFIKFHEIDAYDENVGSISLAKRVLELKNLRLHIFGHIHESYGIYNGECHECFDAECFVDKFDHIIVNASHVNEHYKPVNEPIRVEL